MYKNEDLNFLIVESQGGFHSKTHIISQTRQLIHGQSYKLRYIISEITFITYTQRLESQLI